MSASGSLLTRFSVANCDAWEYYSGTKNHIYEPGWIGGSWQYRDLNVAARYLDSVDAGNAGTSALMLVDYAWTANGAATVKIDFAVAAPLL